MSTTSPLLRALAPLRSRLRRSGIWVAGAALLVGFGVTIDGFLTVDNLLDAARSTAVLAILAVAVAIVVIGGGLDLSVAVILGVTGQLVVDRINDGSSQAGAIALAAIVALVLGLVNGLLVAYAELPPLLVTLATALGFAGLFTMSITTRASGTLPRSATSILSLGRGDVAGVPVPVLVVLVVAVAGWMFLRLTVVGRFVAAHGDNAEAASLSGVPVRPVVALTYVLAALLATVAGLTQLGLSGGYDSRSLVQGTVLYDVFAAVVLGGVSLAGGRWSVVGVVAGAALIGLLVNGMTLLDFDVVQQAVCKSFIVLAALALDARLNPIDDERVRAGDL